MKPIGQVVHARDHGTATHSTGVSPRGNSGHRDNCVGVVLDYVDARGVVANDQDTRGSACDILSSALESAGVSRELAGLALGVSRSRVDAKCSTLVANAPVTLADVLALIDAGGRPLDAAQSIVDVLQSKLDAERDRAALGIESLGPLSMGIIAAMGSLCEGIGAALARRAMSSTEAAELRRRCVVVRRQVSTVSAILGRFS